MEQNFQTSFIPKKSIVTERATSSQPVSFLTIISIFILFAVVIGSGALYFYKGALAKNITQMESNLNSARNRFEPAKIAELQDLDRRLSASSAILSAHIAVTPIFEQLEKITMKTVRFTSFSYTAPSETTNRVVVSMKGLGIGYRSVALQADLFSQNKNFIDPVFANLQLDEKGNVRFDLNFFVDPGFVNYKQILLTDGSPGF